MSMNLIQKVQPIHPITASRNPMQDPNERRRRQLLLVHQASEKTKVKTFQRVLQDSIEISEEGRKFCLSQQDQ